MTKQWREEDTLVPARYLIAMVNQDRTFVDAKRILGFEPKGAYRLIETCGTGQLEHIRRVVDFVSSIWEDKPWYFFTDKNGTYDNREDVCKQRAIKMLWTMATNPRRPIIEKYAGPLYWKYWTKAAATEGSK